MSWKDRLNDKNETLAMASGDWVITFLSEGEEYTFQRGGVDKYGVSFIVDAKHVDTGDNFPNVKYSVTARSILRVLAEPAKITGRVLELTVTGEGISTRYPTKTLRPYKQQKKLK